MAFALDARIDSMGGTDVHRNGVVVAHEDTAAGLDAVESAFTAVRVAPLGNFVRPQLKNGLLAVIVDPLETGPGLRTFFARWRSLGTTPFEPTHLPTLIDDTDTAAIGRALKDLTVDRVVYVVVGNREHALPQLHEFARLRRASDVWVVSEDGRVERSTVPSESRPN
ncbi:MAG TPA: hypothetical protein VGF45_04200 [Polyangia bacterium]